MNAIIILNGTDVTGSCLLSATRIAFDSTKRITTASITVMGAALNAAATKYDSAHYDADHYSVSLRELYEVQILDGRDGTTKLFDGYIFAMTMAQSDTPSFELFYQCDLSDWAAWLDRAVCWDASYPLTLPNSDQGIITALLGNFCPKITLASIAQIVPTIQSYDWATKTCRQVLDDMTTLSMGQWSVDFDGNLTYGLASAAPAAPFGLSTSPDYETTFPVKVSNYKHDFTNPINHAYVRGGADQTTGAAIIASYSDPVSIQQYGECAAGIVDTQIVTGWDAALKAKSMVLTYGYPIETGDFTVWGPDGLQLGMSVHIHEDHIGIDGDYTIIALTMQWEDQYQVRYEAQFGAAQPNLETVLRLLNQRTLWQTTNKLPAAPSAPGPPAAGSVTDASIAPGGLSASSINSVNASTIQGLIVSSQIGSVNASTLIGQLTAGQIASVNAGSIVGVLQAGQIGSVSASVIQGVLQASQIGSVNATAIQGALVASQIQSVSATSITGSISASQIGSVAATSITGALVANQIAAVNATAIQGAIVAGQIASVNASAVQGSLSASQIGGVNASTIQGSITAGQIGSVSATTIQGVVVSSQLADGIVDTLSKYATALTPIQMIKNGDPWPPAMPNKNFPPNSFFYYQPNGNFYQVTPDGLGWAVNNSPASTLMSFYYIGAINATSITGLILAAQIGSVNATTLVGQVQASQIGSVNTSTLQGTISAGQISSVNASAIVGTISGGQITSVDATQITGQLKAAQIFAVNASSIAGQLSAGQIGAVNASSITGAISATQIASITAGQITGQLTATQIASVNASVIAGQIAASQIATVNASAIQGTISAANIGTINASSITGSLNYTQIGSINAATITIGQLQDSQIAGINGAKVSVGSITSDKFNGYSIDVGGAANMPGRIRVFNGSGAMVGEIGYMGEAGYGAYGGWFSVFGAGGTYYGNAPIYTDTAGNLYIRNTNLTGNTITNSNVTGSTIDSTSTINGSSVTNPSLNVSGQIYTSPQTFDATYSTLAFVNQSGADQTNFISRGLVIYYNGQKVGSLVRSPNGAYMAAEFTVGGAYVLIDGANGVRSDAGYLVGSTRVINSAGQFTGTLTGTAAGPVSTNSSIYTGSTVQAAGGVYAGSTYCLNGSGQFVGSGISTGGYIYTSSYVQAGYYYCGGTQVINSSAQWVGNCSASSYGGAAFQGAGVNVGSYGIGGGSLNVGSGPINGGSLGVSGDVSCSTLRSNNGLYVNGQQCTDYTGIWLKGLQANAAVYASQFGIYGNFVGTTLNGGNAITFQDTSGRQWTFRVVGGILG
jgi:hypothetical protein